MPTLLQAALLGVVQGLTEFLPVSSTAHLLIGERLLGFQDPGGVFTVMIQLGSILAVMWLYREKIVSVVTGLPSSPEARRFALMILLATVPALVAGALFSKFVKSVLYGSFVVIALAFIVGGIVMLVVERFRPAPDVLDVDSLPVGRAFAIGVVSGAGADSRRLALGRDDRRRRWRCGSIARRRRSSPSFWPCRRWRRRSRTICWKARHDLGSARGSEIAVGFVMAFIASALVVRPFLNYVRRSGFAPFAWYRIAIGVGLLVALAAGWPVAA